MLFSKQIPLQLIPRRDARFEDFVAGPNEAVVEALRHVPEEGAANIFLSGKPGSGKTHLLNALCFLTRELNRRAFYLSLESLPVDAIGSLQGLEQYDLVCVDDMHVIAGQLNWEEALFHCFNRIRNAGGRLVVSSRLRLSALDLELPDLASRLTWGLRLRLESLDDHSKMEIVNRQAEALGISLPQDVQTYLLKHADRSLPALLGTLRKLHQVALTDKRRITVPLAREVLNTENSPASGSDQGVEHAD